MQQCEVNCLAPVELVEAHATYSLAGAAHAHHLLHPVTAHHRLQAVN